MLPDIDGIDLLTQVREQTDWQMPVIFVTARDSEADIVTGLTAGAEDYITKPVQQQELVARVEAVCRRALPQDGSGAQLVFGNYTIDPQAHTVSLRGTPIALTQKEFELVLFLFRAAGRAMSRDHILESVWNQSTDTHTRIIDTHVSRIRRKLSLGQENGWQLKAIYQHGYRLERTPLPVAGSQVSLPGQ